MPFLSNEDFNVVHSALKGNACAEGIALEIMDQARASVASPGLREIAHDEYGSDEIEIDDEGAGTAPGEGGIWVQAWVWVADDEEEEDEE